MDPIEFRDGMLAYLADHSVTARAAEGESGSGMQYGIITRTPSGGEAWWQLAARSTPSGARTDLPELDTAPALPDSGAVQVADLELVLAHAARAAGASTVERYSTREKVPSLKYGVHAEFPDQTAVFVQLHWSLRPGEEPRESNRYEPRDSI
ncbi:hypothetical protein ACFY0N_00695 [Streptomyces vinaceus]|uniref:hypothetical protein n=1 Tax=Streptomyces vinaceus TaxID=1960 RepID=UPI00368C7125